MRSLFLSLIVAATLINSSLTQSAFAVSEANFGQEMQLQVWPFFESGVTGSFISTVGGKTIRYRVWENPNEIGAIVIFPGRHDPYASFAETIYDLAQQGYSIYAIDHRGQGSSDRLLSDRQKGYVHSFKDYVIDAKTFVDRVVNARPHRHRFILAHSMGGAIAAQYLKDHPSDFDAAALVAPMMKINTAPYPYFVAESLAWSFVTVGNGKKYAPGQKPFNVNATFANNGMTSSQARWQNYQNVFLYNPNLQLGGATNRWLNESFKEDDYIRAHANQISTPLLMLSAGKDTTVITSEELRFCKNAQRCTQVPVYPNANHNILLETDSIRDDALAQILKFYSEN